MTLLCIITETGHKRNPSKKLRLLFRKSKEHYRIYEHVHIYCKNYDLKFCTCELAEHITEQTHAAEIKANQESRDLCIMCMGTAITPQTNNRACHSDTKICESFRQQADPGTQVKPDAVAAVAVGDFNHAAELKCQGRALTFPGNPTPCPLSAGGQRTQKGAGQGGLCHRDEGWGEGQREGGWYQGGTTGKKLRGRWRRDFKNRIRLEKGKKK